MLKVLRKLLDIIYPPSFPCIFCGREEVDLATGICPRCMDTLPRIVNPCPSCGHGLEEGKACPECTAKRKFDRCVIAFEYEGSVRSVILGFKFGNKRYLAKPIGRLMADALDSPLAQQTDYLIPVPLSKKRFKQRGFNQSLLLAEEIASCINKPVLRDVLVKKQENSDQSLLTREERLRNIASVYSCENVSVLHGKNLLLIDDVSTTGYTAEACAACLKAAGAASVNVLVCAGSSLK